MIFLLLTLAVIVLAIPFILWRRRVLAREELDRYSVHPQDLHKLLQSNPDLLIVDARQPLDVLADSTIIPGARRVPPKDLIENPKLIPNDKLAVVYCTCPSEKTSRLIVRRALALNFTQIKLLCGGWRRGRAAVSRSSPTPTAFTSTRFAEIPCAASGL